MLGCQDEPHRHHLTPLMILTLPAGTFHGDMCQRVRTAQQSTAGHLTAGAILQQREPFPAEQHPAISINLDPTGSRLTMLATPDAR